MTDRREALRLLLLTAASSLSSPLLAQARRSRAPIALLVPTSGADAAIGLSIARAASLVLTDPADAGIAVDSGSTPASAEAAARAAVRRGARLILGPLHAAQVRPVLVAAGGVPVISFSNDEGLLESGAFLLGITASQVAATIFDYARGRGVRRVAVLVGEDGWSRQLAAAAQRSAAEFGLALTGLAVAPDSVATPAALERANGGTLPDALLVPGEAATLARGLRGSGVQLLATANALAAAPADLDGAWIAAPDPTALDAFQRSYRERHGGDPGLIAALGYDAALIARGLRAAPALDRAGLLSLAPVAGATGSLRFRSDGSCARQLSVLVADSSGFGVAKA